MTRILLALCLTLAACATSNPNLDRHFTAARVLTDATREAKAATLRLIAQEVASAVTQAHVNGTDERAAAQAAADRRKPLVDAVNALNTARVAYVDAVLAAQGGDWSMLFEALRGVLRAYEALRAAGADVPEVPRSVQSLVGAAP